MKTVRANRKTILLLTLLSAPLLSGCGKQAFFVSQNQDAQQAPGFVTIAPKVDIMLVQDDTGSMIANYSQTQSQVSTFLSSLQAQNWNYHFTTSALTEVAPITQAMASYFDGNWGSLWQSPYPGAVQNDPEDLSATVFTKPANFVWAITPTNNPNGEEPGFDTIYQNVTASPKGTGFLRSDAMLVVLMMSNGDDRSKVNLCYRQDAVLRNGTYSGVVLPCGQVGVATCTTAFPQNYNSNILASPYTGACDNSAASLASYEAAFANLKGLGNQSQVRFYADVAHASTCFGANSYVGTRYSQMSDQISGADFDICSTQLSDVLSTISSNLTTTRLNFRTHYLFMSEQPQPATITVTRYIGGDTNQAVTIAQDPTNGWTYDGMLTNVYAIDSPVPMNLSSGYAVELHGTAELTGSDTAVVNYTPYGVTDSAK